MGKLTTRHSELGGDLPAREIWVDRKVISNIPRIGMASTIICRQ